MESQSTKILNFLSRHQKWAERAQHPICFLRLDVQKKEIQVRRWGRVTPVYSEPYYLWKKLNLRSYVILDDIEDALKRWEKYSPVFSPTNSESPSPKEKLLPISSTLYNS